MRVNIPSWDDYFMSIAETISKRSKDPSRQVGCLIIEPVSKTIRSGGYNGMVAKVAETLEIWSKPTKYKYVCHAEFNAIAIASKNGISTDKCSAYVTSFPCLTCARLLVQAGITKIIFKSGISSGYAEEYKDTENLLGECDIYCIQIDDNIDVPF